MIAMQVVHYTSNRLMPDGLLATELHQKLGHELKCIWFHLLFLYSFLYKKQVPPVNPGGPLSPFFNTFIKRALGFTSFFI